MSKDVRKPVTCPSCGEKARIIDTRYGRRDQCDDCGMWSWHGKPLVSAHVHEARKRCHEVVDAIWKSSANPRKTRGRVYAYLAHVTGLPEPECHMSAQRDVEKLRAIYRAAKSCPGPETVNTWWRAYTLSARAREVRG